MIKRLLYAIAVLPFALVGSAVFLVMLLLVALIDTIFFRFARGRVRVDGVKFR